MKLIEKFMGAVITVVLIASLTGCSAKTQVQADTQTQEQLQTQSKVIEGYKSKLDQANRTIADDKIRIAAKPKIVYRRSEKDKADLQTLIDMARAIEYYGRDIKPDSMREYTHGERKKKGFHDNYEIDTSYINLLWKNNIMINGNGTEDNGDIK